MKVFEVGVGTIESCRTRHWRGTDVLCELFEPNPDAFGAIQNFFADSPNVIVRNVALGDIKGHCRFVLDGESSYVAGLQSPSAVHRVNNPADLRTVIVPLHPIAKYDMGDIDLLLLDAEGSEYPILTNLISRPREIVVEMRSVGVGYQNPNYEAILQWMARERYTLDAESNKREDFIFRR